MNWNMQDDPVDNLYWKRRNKPGQDVITWCVPNIVPIRPMIDTYVKRHKNYTTWQESKVVLKYWDVKVADSLNDWTSWEKSTRTLDLNSFLFNVPLPVVTTSTNFTNNSNFHNYCQKPWYLYSHLVVFLACNKRSKALTANLQLT